MFVKKVNEIFDVAFCRDIDCTNKDQVRDEFMIPLLNTLLANLDDIDRVYLEDLEQTERRARKDYQDFLSKLPSMKNFDVGIQQGLSASKKGKACYEKLSADLVNSVVYWGKEKDEPTARSGTRCSRSWTIWMRWCPTRRVCSVPLTRTGPCSPASCGQTPFIMSEMRSQTGL